MALPSLRWFSLRTRFILGTGSMLLPLVVLAGIVFYSQHVISRSFDHLVYDITAEKDVVVRLQLLTHETMAVPHRYVLSGNSEERQRFAQLSRQIDDFFADSERFDFTLQEERESFSRARKEWQALRATGEAILTLENPVGDTRALAPLQQLRRQGLKLVGELEWIEEMVVVEITDLTRSTSRLEQQMRWWLGVIFLAGVAIAITSGILLARSVLRPVRDLETGANRFRAGELGFRLTPRSRDELAKLKLSFNAMAAALEESQHALRELSVRDQLTGLFNHREFYRLLGEETARSRRYGHPLSLLMLDLDYFKRVNDTYGHRAGDQVLRRLPELIRSQLRINDVPCRYGGEEFGLILPETGREAALEVAERIRSVIAQQPIRLTEGASLRVSVSIGAATFPDLAADEEALVAAADLALYQAKRTGRNQVCLAEKGGNGEPQARS